ncbi:malonyl-ACP O-methyltransferase BioC [Ketobacter sp.]|uniref:malonyl-ACP O-methyltransferase BioC n=1 Tax=Ketobacter sp. TaxID=2083498 RepID=UPI000F149F11|nr:malonyl-ACP O-methyltransferase BioC [Ketobacter sp.]RLT93262.1 MAG: malonyl-[acyl-carrier protein] O-methyltransferase BioC [Ketobacter sp.]
MTVDKKAIALSFSRAAPRYDSVAHVQRQVGEAMLAVLASEPAAVASALDIGCGTGALTIQLAPYAEHITALDIAPGMLAVAQQNDQQRVISEWVCADAERLPFPAQSFDLVFSSFALQWCDDLSRVMADVYAILRPGGRFVFSIPVENTLRELKLSWRKAESRYHHVNDFPALAEIQGLLDVSPFLTLQLQERLDVVYYESVRELTRELKTLGAHQVTSNRTHSLTGKKTLFKMMSNYEHFRNHQGLLPASWHYCVIALQKPR